jgi:hypothetical protein
MADTHIRQPFLQRGAMRRISYNKKSELLFASSSPAFRRRTPNRPFEHDLPASASEVRSESLLLSLLRNHTTAKRGSQGLQKKILTGGAFRVIIQGK